jgi:thioredoxin reductase
MALSGEVRTGALNESGRQWEQLQATPNIEVRLSTRLVDASGNGRLESVTVEDTRSGCHERSDASALFVLISAQPRTEWLRGVVTLGEGGYILTGRDIPLVAWALSRSPLPFETSSPGVFGVGDVRYGSVSECRSRRRGFSGRRLGPSAPGRGRVDRHRAMT